MDDIRPIPKPTPRLKHAANRDGTTREQHPIPDDIRAAVKQRDSIQRSGGPFWRCQGVECSSAAAEIHHIIPRSQFGKKKINERDALGNLVSLCRRCHGESQLQRVWSLFWREASKRGLLAETNRQARDSLAAQWKGGGPE